MTKKEFIEKYKRKFSYANRENQIAEMEADLDAYAKNKLEGHKFEINGFWLMLDPNADDATVQYVTNFCIDCTTCRHGNLEAHREPCNSCIKQYELGENNWEAKQ